jgi:hypothetical protein
MKIRKLRRAYYNLYNLVQSLEEMELSELLHAYHGSSLGTTPIPSHLDCIPEPVACSFDLQEIFHRCR